MKVLISALVFISPYCFSQAVSSLPVNEFEKKLDSTKIQLLDVRRPEEYQAGHLHGAFQADWLNRQRFEEIVQYLDKTKPVYVYCLSGSRSAAAANWLAEKGFTAVNMQGGISAWKKEGKPLEESAMVEQMKEEKYMSLIRSNPLVLVDFGAEWCIPCKKMQPVLEKLQQEHSELKLIKIDAGTQTEIARKYNVEGLPVFILYKEGKQVWRETGVVEQKEFEKAIRNFE